MTRNAAATKWLKEFDPARQRRRRGPRKGDGKEPRDLVMKSYRPAAIKEFVEDHRHYKDKCSCLFVPGASKGHPARVRLFDKTISASRYMCLLTHGTPRSSVNVSRHLCGNGHLSCVNPHHIVWGDECQNKADEVRHRAAGGDVQDRINSIA